MVLTKTRRVFTDKKKRTILKSLGFKKSTQKKIQKRLNIVPSRKIKPKSLDDNVQKVKVVINVRQKKSKPQPSKPKPKRRLSFLEF